MSAFTESVVEEAALDWLAALGYAVRHGPEPVAEEANIDDLRRQMKDMQERLERMSKEPKKEE